MGKGEGDRRKKYLFIYTRFLRFQSVIASLPNVGYFFVKSMQETVG
jgi:hypothetical protein